MSAYTYSILTGDKSVSGSIRNWVNRSDVPAEQVLHEAQAFIYQSLRVREMMEADTITLALGESTADLPEGFLDPIEFTPFGWSAPLPFVHESGLRAYRDENGNLISGTPTRWRAFGLRMEVNVEADAAFSGRLEYYDQPAFLAATTYETNFLTARYPTLLRVACLMFAYEHAKDGPQRDREAEAAIALIQAANATNELFRRGQHAP